MAFVEVQNTMIPTDELIRIRTALESIAVSLNRALALPEGPAYPEKPIGVKDVGSYAQALMSSEDGDDLRAKFKAAGMSDAEIEERLVAFLADAGEETTE